MRYSKKLIRSGDVIEFIEYERPVELGKPVKEALGRSSVASEDEKRNNRRKTLSRAKTNLRRLINANINVWYEKPKFVTLTFADNVTDVRQANYEFKKFRQRLEYRFKRKLKYVVVVEFQKRGAVHYHVVFFNLPYIEANELAFIWENGFIKVNAIDDVDNVGAYVTKYMTKQDYNNLKEDRLAGEKSYFTSRGLIKPDEIVDEKEIDQVLADLSQYKVYETNFYNDYCGNIRYEQYNLKRN